MSLTSAYENQAFVFAAAFSVLQRAIAEHAFPSASIAVSHQGRLVALKAFGRPTFATDFDFPVTPGTLFDLASLTKVLATTTTTMILYERGLLELDSPIAGTVPEFLTGANGQADSHHADSCRRAVTFRMLLTHSSGLPAYEKLFLKAQSRDDLLRAAFTMPLSADPGTHAEYSDIGFIILGAALERIAEEPLDAFCQREIFGPLQMTHTTFNPPTELRAKIPPTADERKRNEDSSSARSTFRNRIIQGEVQDENAFLLGGVAPHAGLFSTAEDLAQFADALLRDGNLIVRPETIALFTRREPAPPGTTRALGWDTPSNPSQSGRHLTGAYGHLGYTGTSLWIDPTRQLSITLLTNRTWPDCSNQAIKLVRPKFHDAVVEALEKIA